MNDTPYNEQSTRNIDMNEETLTTEQQELFAQKVTERLNNLLVTDTAEAGKLTLDKEMLPNVTEVNFLSDGSTGRSVHVSSDWIIVGPNVDSSGQTDGSTIETALVQINDDMEMPYIQDESTLSAGTAVNPELVVLARIIEADGSAREPLEIVRIVDEGVMLNEAFDPSSKLGWSMVRTTLQALERHKMDLILNAREQNLPEILRRETMLPIVNAYAQQFQEAVRSSGSRHRAEVFDYITNQDPELINSYNDWTQRIVNEADSTEDLSTIVHTNLLVLLPHISAGFNDEEFVNECLSIFNDMQEYINTLPVDDGLTNLVEQLVNLLRENTEQTD